MLNTQIDPELIRSLVAEYGTPFWLYDANIIKQRISQLKAFDTIRYAQKACSNVHILELMRAEGVVVDAVSNGEIMRSLAANYTPRSGDMDEVIFTSDIIDHKTLKTVKQHGITVNVGSLDMLETIGENLPGHRVWLRINPGFGHGHSAQTNTGGVNSKHGIWYTQIPQAIEMIERYSLELYGIHMHIGSGGDYEHLTSVCDAMVQSVKALNCDIKAISAGGGLPIPYFPTEKAVDAEHYFTLWNAARREIEQHLGHSVRLEIEPGRFLMAESAVLVSEVFVVKETPKHQFVMVDSGFNDLMRPAFYGSHHEISVLKKERDLSEGTPKKPTVIAGPLCEAGDVFTQSSDGNILPRELPPIQKGDYLLFHDVGAYGASMSSNYNSKPLIPELLQEGEEVKLIRRGQTINDLLALELPDLLSE